MAIFNKLKVVYEELDKGKFGQPIIIVHNLMNGIAQRIENRKHPAMELCALFINYKDEDREHFNKDDITKKIEDWSEYAVNDFFQLAANLVGGFIAIYNEISENTSKRETKKKTIINEDATK
jgi:hypothetical protein